MGVRRALRARRTPIFGIFPEFSGIFRLEFFFPYNIVIRTQNLILIHELWLTFDPREYAQFQG